MLWRGHLLWLRMTVQGHFREVYVLFIKLTETESHIDEIRTLFFEIVRQLEFLVLA